MSSAKRNQDAQSYLFGINVAPIAIALLHMYDTADPALVWNIYNCHCIEKLCQNQYFTKVYVCSWIDCLGDNISFWYFSHFCWLTSVLALNAFDFYIIINVFDFLIWQDGLWSKARHRCHLFWVLSVMSHRWRLAWDVWCFVVKYSDIQRKLR